MKRKLPLLDKRYRRHRALTAQERAVWEAENSPARKPPPAGGRAGEGGPEAMHHLPSVTPLCPPASGGRFRGDASGGRVPEDTSAGRVPEDASGGMVPWGGNDKKIKKKKLPAPVSPLLDAPTLAKLRKNALTIDATLDLHGHTSEDAYHALHHFITRAHAKGLKLVLVITGKGKGGEVGVLRRMLPRWLEETALRALIIAYDRAHDKHGGSGAWYVRIKKV